MNAREFVVSRIALQEMLKKILQDEGKWYQIKSKISKKMRGNILNRIFEKITSIFVACR